MMHGSWFGSGYCPIFGGYGNFGLWNILMILGVIVVIVGVVLFLRKGKVNTQEALDLLKIQFIEGKITEEEYLNRKNVIERK